jgi:hypothetical protein
MTAVAIIRGADRVHVVTDGKARVSVGRSVPMSKIEIFAHANMVVVARGLQQHLAYASGRLPLMGGSYDEIKAACCAVLLQEWDAYVAGLVQVLRVPAEVASFAEFYFAGISERTGPDSFAILTHSIYKDAKPWTIIDAGAVQISPADGALYDRFPVRSIDESNIAAKSVDIVQAQLALEVHSVLGGEDAKASDEIGLFVQLTTITKASITSRITHRWRED